MLNFLSLKCQLGSKNNSITNWESWITKLERWIRKFYILLIESSLKAAKFTNFSTANNFIAVKQVRS